MPSRRSGRSPVRSARFPDASGRRTQYGWRESAESARAPCRTSGRDRARLFPPQGPSGRNRLRWCRRRDLALRASPVRLQLRVAWVPSVASVCYSCRMDDRPTGDGRRQLFSPYFRVVLPACQAILLRKRLVKLPRVVCRRHSRFRLRGVASSNAASSMCGPFPGAMPSLPFLLVSISNKSENSAAWPHSPHFVSTGLSRALSRWFRPWSVSFPAR